MTKRSIFPVPRVVGLLTLVACGGADDKTPEATSTPPSSPSPTGLPASPTPLPPTEAPNTPLPPTEVPNTPPPPTPTPDAPTTPEPVVRPNYNLGASVEVKYDTWGIPHIYGDTLEDVLFGQGYVGAADRLWQMDYIRRLGQGRLSELLGESFVDDDLYSRTLQFAAIAEVMAQNLPTEDSEMYAFMEAYAAGINTYLDDAILERNGASLPPQIQALGYVPEVWTVADILTFDKLQSYSLSGHHSHELGISLAADYLVSEAAAMDLIRTAPIDDTAVVPGYWDTYEGESHSAGVSSDLAQNVKARRASLKPLPPGTTRDQIWRAARHLGELRLPWHGSNNWVISGDLTESGYPIISGDTHEGVEAPPTYWQVHLSSADGEIDAVGFSFAGAPFLMFGHNDHSAWTPTTNYIDVSDVFQEDYNPVNDTVLSNGQRIKVESRTETIMVRQEGGTVADLDAREFTLKKVPHHGPILPAELLGGVPLTLSAAWTGFAPRTAFRFVYLANTMRSYEDLREAQRHQVAGAVNMVYADIEGNIGYSARIDVPVRKKYDPVNPPWLILPGTGEYDWTGEIYEDDAIPWTYNPEAGFVTTANADVVGNTFDNDPLNEVVYISAVYDSGTRAERITDLITSFRDTEDPISADDSASIQGDTYSRLALRTLPYLMDAQERRQDLVTGDVASGVAELAEWDYFCRGEDKAPLIFHAWLLHSLRECFGDETSPEFFADLSGDYVHIFARDLIYFLDATAANIDDYSTLGTPFPSASGTNYFDDTRTEGVLETRDEILLRALSLAMAELKGMYGDDMSAWSWAASHQITFTDDVGDELPEATVGPFPLDGGLFTVDVADFRLSRGGALVKPFDVGNSPSQRFVYVMEPGKIRALDVNAGGQSERPGEPHFFDQIDLYLDNQYRELPYYPEEVEESTVRRLVLPAGFPATGAPLSP